MANGYIGKISAIVTANTSDLSRKLAGAKEDVDTFANRMVRSFNSASQAAEKSFAGLFTPLQRLQRQFTGRELFNLGEDAGKIQRLNREVEQLVLASRQLAAPLAAAAKQFDALTLGTQRGFSGALSEAQAALLRVKDSVKLVGDAGASGFASISKQVQSTIVSINQLAEATKRVRALPTGNELAFSDPRLAGRLAAAQRAGEQAMSLAPEQIAANPQIAGLVRQINRVSELSVEASARLKNAIASGLDTQPAQIELVRLGGVLDGLIGRLNRNYQLIIDTSSSVKGVEELKRSVDFVLSSNKRPQGGLGLFGSQIGTEAERAIAEAKKLDAQFRSLPEAARAGLSGLAGIASRIADEVSRTGSGAQNLLSVIDRLRTGVAAAQPAGPVASTGLIIRPPDPPDNLFAAGGMTDRFRADQVDREIAIRQRLGRQVDDPVRQLSGVESRITSVKSALDSLPASVSSRFIPAIRAAEDELVRLSLAPGRTAEQIERLSAEVRKLEADSRRASSVVDFVLSSNKRPQGGLGLFGSQVGTEAERAIAEAKKVDAQFRSLPEAARAGLSGLAGIASRIADEVNRTGAGAQNLLSVLDRLRTGVAAAQPTAPVASTGLIVRPPDPPDNLFTAGGMVDRFRADQTDRETAIRQRLGRQVDDPVRQLSGIESRITSVKAALDSLPASVSSRFIPSIRAAEDALVRLSLSPGRTAEQIERLSAEVRQLEADSRRASSAMNFRGSFGGLGVEGINVGLDENALRGYGAQLQVLQATLGRVSAEARGPAVAAFERLRTVIADAMDRGELETAQTRAEIRRLTAEAVAATAAVAGVSRLGLARRLERAGDIGRGFGGNSGLALQQAAFAFEDFFSVQGGLDQSIRAAGNNISQLGFIIGGTSGLVAGIVVGIGAQLAAMYIKWANNGKTAADELKALNSVLERQESLASKLADSFGKVADAISRVGLSDAASRSLREQRDLLDEIRKQQDERRRASRADIDPAVQRERAFQAARRRELEAATDPGERVRLQIELQRRRERERRAVETAANRLPIDPSSVPGLITAGRVAVSEKVSRFETRVNPSTAAGARARERAIQAAARAEGEAMSAAVAASQDPVGEARRLIRVEQRRLADEINANEGFFGSWWQTPAQAERRRRLQQLEQTQSRLTYGDQVDSASRQGAESSLRSLGRLEIAFEAIDQAFTGGGSQIGTSLQLLQEQLSAANDRLAEAQKGTDEQALAQTKAARDEIIVLEEKINKERSAAESVLAFSQALDRAGGNLVRQVAQESASAADEARRSANLENARANLGLVSRADADFARRQEDRARAAAAESAERQRQIEAEGRRLRNEFERGALPAGVRDAVARRDQAQRAIDSARLVESDPRSTVDQRRAATVQRRAAEEQLAAAQAQINAAFDQTDAAKRQREASNEADRRGQLQRLLDEQLKRGRDLIESPGARAARESAARIEDLVAARDEARKNGDLATAGRADRAIQREFRDVTGTPAERAAAETADAIERIRAVTRAAVAAGGGPNARAQGDAAIQRTIEDRFRSTAPAIFALADAVQNSVLMGPSRAALTATDITTAEGARELTRLIRGDDPARDQNLVELRRQTQALQEVVQILRDAGVPIANN